MTHDEQREKLVDVVRKLVPNHGDSVNVHKMADAILAAGFVMQGAGLSEEEREKTEMLRLHASAIATAAERGSTLYRADILAKGILTVCAATLRAGRSEYDVCYDMVRRVMEAGGNNKNKTFDVLWDELERMKGTK